MRREPLYVALFVYWGYTSLMLNRRNVHNSAILKPWFVKCKSLQLNGSHAFAQTVKGYAQCVDCGKIKVDKDSRKWPTHRQPS